MLTPQVMGLLLLGLVWLTALMVALDAVIDLRVMLRRLAEWKTSLLEGTVVASELATHEVEQRIKQLDGDEPGLVFFDRKHLSTVLGGEVRVGAVQLEVSAAPGAEVWIDEDTRQAAAACSSAFAFDGLAAAAKGPGGGLRTVRTSLRQGAQVWLVGSRAGPRLEATMVANFDPRGWVKGRVLRISGLIALNLAWVGVGTVLALWPPVFGAFSIAGALVLLGHFLGMTALAMSSREKSRSPSIAFLRGSWKRNANEATAAVSLSPVAGEGRSEGSS